MPLCVKPLQGRGICLVSCVKLQQALAVNVIQSLHELEQPQVWL